MTGTAGGRPTGRVWGTPGRPAVIAHRGSSSDRPENTAAAFDEAVAAGADGLELDLRATADGEIVVWHDPDLRRLGRPSPDIADTGWDELAGVDVGGWFDPRWKDERLLRLADVAGRWGGRVALLLEVKVERWSTTVERLVDDVVGAAATLDPGSVGLLSFDPRVLERAAAAAPDLPRVLNVAHRSALRAVGAVPVDAVDVDIDVLDRAVADEVGGAGLPLLCWSVDDDRALAEVLDLGVSGLISNRPRWLVEELGRRDLR